MLHHRYPITYIFIAIVLLCCSSCDERKSKIQGDWILDSTAGSTEIGMQLSRGGQAASINQCREHYTSWNKHKKQFILSGKRFYDNDITPFNDTFTIQRLSNDELWLQAGDSTLLKYTRL